MRKHKREGNVENLSGVEGPLAAECSRDLCKVTLEPLLVMLAAGITRN